MFYLIARSKILLFLFFTWFFSSFFIVLYGFNAISFNYNELYVQEGRAILSFYNEKNIITAIDEIKDLLDYLLYKGTISKIFYLGDFVALIVIRFYINLRCSFLIYLSELIFFLIIFFKIRKAFFISNPFINLIRLYAFFAPLISTNLLIFILVQCHIIATFVLPFLFSFFLLSWSFVLSTLFVLPPR